MTTMKGNLLDPTGGATGKQLDRLLICLRTAIDESGWKHEALAVAMDLGANPSSAGSYLSKLLAGEKPLAARHLVALPDDVEELFSRRYAEQFGQIVVRPLVGEAAIKALAGVMVGVARAVPHDPTPLSEPGVMHGHGARS